MNKRLGAALLAMGCLLGTPAEAQSEAGFSAWLDRFAQEAQYQGISPATIRQVWPTLALDDSVIELDHKQPEGQITFASYVKKTLTAARIKKGRLLLDDNGETLRQVSAAYGVPPSVIVALWGIESSFGTQTGHYDVLNALATLAYEGRRADFFKSEFLEALRIVDEEGIAPASLRGSWAGAMGQCQFMPSTYRKYAVDFDGDGRRDIWGDDADALASIARYLAAEGWQAGQKWGREVRLTRVLPGSWTGLDVQKSLAEWSQSGVVDRSGAALPAAAFPASLVQPDGPGGRAFLVYDNFRALMRWNRSTYFAASVGLLADQLADGS